MSLFLPCPGAGNVGKNDGSPFAPKAEALSWETVLQWLSTDNMRRKETGMSDRMDVLYMAIDGLMQQDQDVTALSEHLFQ
jgi:hypothetical protein